ncbi:HIT family protein [Paracoccus sp. NSM]|uniref:HIT family protein n=1 Tax=Paracoccus sp. NSM TaxID=3457784 RepID=UPI0040372310
MTECLFCKIAQGALPAHVLHQDDHVMAFLDLHPIREGHALVIPRAHHVWFEDMPADLAARVTHCAQGIARAMKALYPVDRVSMFFTGIHVPHAHAHVVPMHHVHDVTSTAYLADGAEGFSVPPRLEDGRMAQVAADLARAMRP